MLFLLFIPVFLIITGIVLTKRQANMEVALNALHSGEANYQRGKLHRALEYADQVLEVAPENLPALRLKASALNKLKRFGEAADVSRLAVEISDDEDAASSLNLARSLLEVARGKDNSDEAKPHFDASIAAAKQACDVYLSEGLEDEETGTYREAQYLLGLAQADRWKLSRTTRSVENDKLFSDAKESFMGAAERRDLTGLSHFNLACLSSLWLERMDRADRIVFFQNECIDYLRTGLDADYALDDYTIDYYSKRFLKQIANDIDKDLEPEVRSFGSREEFLDRIFDAMSDREGLESTLLQYLKGLEKGRGGTAENE